VPKVQEEVKNKKEEPTDYKKSKTKWKKRGNPYARIPRSTGALGSPGHPLKKVVPPPQSGMILAISRDVAVNARVLAEREEKKRMSPVTVMTQRLVPAEGLSLEILQEFFERMKEAGTMDPKVVTKGIGKEKLYGLYKEVFILGLTA